eukprot:9378421-Pyramimonas_sp.AAC.1
MTASTAANSTTRRRCAGLDLALCAWIRPCVLGSITVDLHSSMWAWMRRCERAFVAMRLDVSQRASIRPCVFVFITLCFDSARPIPANLRPTLRTKRFDSQEARMYGA